MVFPFALKFAGWGAPGALRTGAGSAGHARGPVHARPLPPCPEKRGTGPAGLANLQTLEWKSSFCRDLAIASDRITGAAAPAPPAGTGGLGNGTRCAREGDVGSE